MFTLEKPFNLHNLAASFDLFKERSKHDRFA